MTSSARPALIMGPAVAMERRKMASSGRIGFSRTVSSVPAAFSVASFAVLASGARPNTPSRSPA